MCYFDQKRWKCGYWRWARFSRQCNRASRTGETCGLKLVMTTLDEPNRCKLCYNIDKKHRRLVKMSADIERWLRQGNCPATLERTMDEYGAVEGQMREMQLQHCERAHGVC